MRRRCAPNNPWLAETMRDLSGLGSTVALTLFTLATVGYLVLVKARSTALLVALSVASGSIFVGLLKNAFGRLRPDAAFSEHVFLLVGLSTAVRWALGGVALAIGAINVKDFAAPGRGVSLSIPAAAKPGLYARMRAVLQADALLPALVGVAALAVVVNFVELLCTAGLPAIYTAVLAQQGLGALAHYGYLGLYIVGYIADDALMVTAAVVALSSRKLSQGAGRWLKLVSGAVMLVLGATLILRPEWLV